MDLKYIYNEQGEKESVIVPIDIWESQNSKVEIGEQRINALRKLKESFKNVNTSEMIDELKKMRNEWESTYDSPKSSLEKDTEILAANGILKNYKGDLWKEYEDSRKQKDWLNLIVYRVIAFRSKKYLLSH